MRQFSLAQILAGMTGVCLYLGFMTVVETPGALGRVDRGTKLVVLAAASLTGWCFATSKFFK